MLVIGLRILVLVGLRMVSLMLWLIVLIVSR